MSTKECPSDFHPQDWIIVIEALAQWAGAPDGAISERRERAYELIEAIAAEEGLPADELLRQATASWPS
jgi:hypothetical protein